MMQSLKVIVARIQMVNQRWRAFRSESTSTTCFSDPRPPADKSALSRVRGLFPDSYLEFLQIADGWTGYFYEQVLLGACDVLQDSIHYRHAKDGAGAFFDGNEFPWSSSELFVVGYDPLSYCQLVVPKREPLAGQYLEFVPDEIAHATVEDLFHHLLTNSEDWLRQKRGS